jgi:hypothetical protein
MHACNEGLQMLAGVVITSHSGVASPVRNALRALFESLECSNARQKQGSNQFRLPMFMTPHTTYETVKVGMHLDTIKHVQAVPAGCMVVAASTLEIDLEH